MKRCLGCGVPLLICEACQKLKKELEVVCHLCEEQNIEPKCNKPKLAQQVHSIPECGVCGMNFKSRNAMFRHIKETGHADRKARRK